MVEIGGVASDDGKMTVVLINKGNIGSTTLVAILDDKMASCRISVSPVEVSGISINPESSDLFVGEELYLTVKISPDNATFPVISWDSSDSEVASVDNGHVIALSAGEADITATCSGFNAVCHISVSNVAVKSISLSVQSKE